MAPQFCPHLQINTMMCNCYWWLILVCSVGLVKAQEETTCYGPGSIALSVILSILLTALLLGALYYLWQKYRKRKELILETDPEKGKGEYAFDNPGFKDPSLTPVGKSLEKSNKSESSAKQKWNQWSPLSALTVKSPERKKTLDDSAIDGNEVKVVALRSQDFTGLGFNICGNMKDGIYIKDVLHHGPASESGKLNSGDRINSVTISFEHMVYEDALAILSYASPYEVIIEARSGKIINNISGQGAYPNHPVYRSSSCTELLTNSTKRQLFGNEEGSLSSNYSSLQKSRSNMTTLERKESKSPQNVVTKKIAPKTQLTPEQLKNQLEQRILADHQHNLKHKNDKSPYKEEAEIQKTENKFQKFGIRVLPPEKSPKTAELSQNENNINLERQPVGIDEVDDTKPQVKKREKKAHVNQERPEENFERNTVGYGSGIKRDANGIPQEIPNYMMNAAVAARSNRKSSDDRGKVKEEEVDKTPKKTKGKAPAPPEEKLKESDKCTANKFDEIQLANDEVIEIKLSKDEPETEETEVELRVKDEIKDYNSDSDLENDNQSSVNTIELNSSDITIHHAEENEDRQNRRTASTGDLTKIQRTHKSSTGTLERAQSLDITDTGMPTLSKKRKGGRIEDEMKSDEDIFGKVMMSKEPRLSLILDGLNTFQRNRLKKSTEWGNLEDAILKLNQEDENFSKSNEDFSLEEVKFDFGTKSEEFDALMNKINEIKRESMDLTPAITEENVASQTKQEKKVKNQIWPTFGSENTESRSNGEVAAPKIEVRKDDHPRSVSADKRQRKPAGFEETSKEEKQIVKPAVPEKKDFLLRSPPPIPVPDFEETSPVKVNEEPIPDETKTRHPTHDTVHVNVVDLTKNFIFTEKIACSQEEDDYKYSVKAEDTNISDDIKVSRHSLENLEDPKSDDAKMNITNVTVNNPYPQEEDSLSVEVNTNDTNEFYTTALDNTIRTDSDTSRITISTPDIIKNVTITEAINTLNNDVIIQGPSSLTIELPKELMEEQENKVPDRQKSSDDDSYDNSVKNNSSLTYITEIQVITPNSSNSANTNISEIEIIPNVNNNERNLDNEFENYVKNFESNVKNFESNIQRAENNFESPPKADIKSIMIADKSSAEKEAHKIQEIAEEQLKKLPEMRFTTSSYESPKTPTDNKRQSIELLRSNFERSPPKPTKTEIPKSRIPIATTTKTPPTSPERRDSRNLDMENDKAILELMSSPTIHSTPFTSKYQLKSPTKNVTVTSIRSNSKIPSGLPVLGGGNRPPIPPRKQEDNVVQVSNNGGVESSFKQWVFNPSDHSVTNIVVSESKQQK